MSRQLQPTIRQNLGCKMQSCVIESKHAFLPSHRYNYLLLVHPLLYVNLACIIPETMSPTPRSSSLSLNTSMMP